MDHFENEMINLKGKISKGQKQQKWWVDEKFIMITNNLTPYLQL